MPATAPTITRNSHHAIRRRGTGWVRDGSFRSTPNEALEARMNPPGDVTTTRYEPSANPFVVVREKNTVNVPPGPDVTLWFAMRVWAPSRISTFNGTPAMPARFWSLTMPETTKSTPGSMTVPFVGVPIVTVPWGGATTTVTFAKVLFSWAAPPS